MIPILDTHVHMLYPDKLSYPWCEQVPELNKGFFWEDYLSLVDGKGVAGSIFMEVDVSEHDMKKEVDFFSQLVKENNNTLLGVIAACRPELDDFQYRIESVLTDSVCGMRRILHDQPDEISQTSRFRDNIRSLSEHGLTFDMCFLERQLPLAYELARACPDNQFILNHCGNPVIQNSHFPEWKAAMQQLASLPNVACKVSGILANCTNAAEANLMTLHPWLESTVEVFGFDRVVWGSDWPVCNLTQNLPAWLMMSREFAAQYSEDEKHALFHRNAESIYNRPLNLSSDLYTI